MALTDDFPVFGRRSLLAAMMAVPTGKYLNGVFPQIPAPHANVRTVGPIGVPVQGAAELPRETNVRAISGMRTYFTGSSYEIYDEDDVLRLKIGAF